MNLDNDSVFVWVIAIGTSLGSLVGIGLGFAAAWLRGRLCRGRPA